MLVQFRSLINSIFGKMALTVTLSILTMIGFAYSVHAAEVLNVARDPSIVPPPITRKEPTTIKIKLTVKEVTADITDGSTYAFWTFDGTVPGPMLRVMEGDTVEFTLVNPKESVSGHNIDLHAVNGHGGGAAVSNVNPWRNQDIYFQGAEPGRLCLPLRIQSALASHLKWDVWRYCSRA